ncbi:LexA family transcriptional regulator [Dyella kyungheensis]|uniref:LexA family transcriptional regulator n=1 Tax=Dyella kyungheensis TaxID=1242174 RepID=UPI003CF7A1C7
MNYLKSNLNFLIKRDRTSGNALAVGTGIDQSTINRIMNGKVESPRDPTVQPIADHFGISVHELKYVDLRSMGEAQMGGEAAERQTSQGAVSRIYPASDLPAQGAAKLNPFATAPFMNVSRSWLEALTETQVAAVRYAFANDDSMKGEIEKGDVVFIDTSVNQVTSEAIYAFTYFQVPHIKRGAVVGKGLRFTGTRQYVNSIPVETAEEFEGLVIIGKVFASMSLRRF